MTPPCAIKIEARSVFQRAEGIGFALSEFMLQFNKSHSIFKNYCQTQSAKAK